MPMTGSEELEKLRNDPNHFTVIYSDYRDNTLRWLSRYHKDYEEIQDVYQDAVLVLYENVKRPEFQLTASVQTYLNSICRNQLLTKHRKNSKMHLVAIDDYDAQITDWFHDNDNSPEKEERLSLLEKAFEAFRIKNEKCYQILKMQYYDKFKMSKIADLVGLSNSRSAITQANKCRGKLYNLMNEAV
jgi:RNA polymerase sigma factor (sigma-70 family)